MQSDEREARGGMLEDGVVSVDSRIQSTLLETRLDNGLQMIGQHIPGVESVASVFWVRTGSRDESLRLSGISHFLEHMAFKGTKTRSYEDINREFEELGAENNAFTSLEMTAFHARVLGDRLAPTIDLLADLTRPVLDSGEFDRERNVILEEIARHNDQPYSVVFEEFLQTFFPGQPLGRSTLGSPESITAMTVDDMREYWEERYGANNILFSVAGNFEWDQVVEQVQKLTSDWHTCTFQRDHFVPETPRATSVLQANRWNQEHIVLGMPSISQRDPRYYQAAVLGNILGDDSGSRLFWSINQTGLADQVGAGTFTFSDAGLIFAIAVTEPGKARQTLDTIQEELKKLQEGPISPEELEAAKMKLLTSTVIEGESTMARMLGLVDSWLSHDRLETLEEIRGAIEAVTIDDLRSLMDKHPLVDNQVLVALGPLAETDLVASHPAPTR